MLPGLEARQAFYHLPSMGCTSIKGVPWQHIVKKSSLF